MSTSALIKTSSLAGFRELVTNLGGDPDTLLQGCHLDPEKVARLEGVISHRAEMCAIARAGQQLDCVDFGLRLALNRDLQMLGPVAAVALTSRSVGDALEKIIEYLHWFSPASVLRLQRDINPGETALIYDVLEGLPRYRQVEDHALVIMLNFMKALLGDDFRPVEVTLNCNSPVSQERYREIFRSQVQLKEEHTALVLKTEDLTRSIHPRDEDLHRLLDLFTEEVVSDHSIRLEQQVQHLVENLLPTHNCNLNTIAAQLGFHPRTLQRELASHDISFERLLDEARRTLANQYLAEYEMPLMQVAGLLGYSEQSCLNRACKRWFSCSPTQRRLQLRH